MPRKAFVQKIYFKLLREGTALIALTFWPAKCCRPLFDENLSLFQNLWWYAEAASPVPPAISVAKASSRMKQLLKPFSRCWAVGSAGRGGRVGSSRLEFGEAEARWKVTKSRHVIAEGFLRSLSTGSRAATRAGAATRPTRAGTARMCCTCTSGRPTDSWSWHLPRSSDIHLCKCLGFSFECLPRSLQPHRISKPRMTMNQELFHTLSISIISSRAHCLDSRSCSLSASGKSGQAGKEVTETCQSRANIETQMQLTYNLVRLDATRTSLGTTCPYMIQLVCDRFCKVLSFRCFLWILTPWLQECAEGVCLSPNWGCVMTCTVALLPRC